MENNSQWRKCSSCKTSISFSKTYYICSVSTCQRHQTGYVFCSVPCWDAHVPIERHRDAWALERTAPSRVEWARQLSEQVRTQVETTKTEETLSDGELPTDILIVASKLKQYIKARSGFNTSANVLDVLSDKVRALCDEAMVRAQADGRKTVLDRDF